MPAARFRFSLQKVLDLRVWEEKQAENALAAKTGQCARVQFAIEQMLVRRRDTFLNRSAGGLDLTLMAAHDAFRVKLGRDIEKNEEELARLTVEREDLLTVYSAARRRREVLSKLSEKQALAFRKAQEKREQLRLDDLNTAAYIRKMTAEEPVG